MPKLPDERLAYRRPAPPNARKDDLLRTPADFEPRRKDNLFLWTVFLLLLVGFSMCCWIGSYLIFNRPELPLSYKVLRKLKKIDLPQRFKVNAAPQGEFLTAEKLFERYNKMSPSELRETNRQLERNYLRNYPPSTQLIPYVKGQFTILDSYELTPKDFFPAGVAVLAASVDFPKLLIEQAYTADAAAAPTIKRNLQTGMNIELRRTYDLTAIVHVTKLPTTGHIQLTTVPLNYGSYVFTGANGGFSLAPPLELHIAAGLPMIREARYEEANKAYLAFRQKAGLGPMLLKKKVAEASAKPTESAIKGVDAPLNPAPSPAVIPEPTPALAQVTPPPPPSPKPGKEPPRAIAVSPATLPAATPALVAAQITPTPAKEIRVERALPVNDAPPVVAVQRPTPLPALKAVSPQSPGGLTLQPFLGAPSSGNISSAAAGPSSAAAGSRTWPMYAPGRAPSGKNLQVNQVGSFAQRIGQNGEPQYYLSGQFVVRALGEDKARGTKKAVLRSTNADGNVRILVEYPSDRPAPAEGTQVVRDEQRPYQILGVSQVADGTVNVYAREIITP